MKLQVFDREVGLPKQRMTAQRNLSTGTVTPQATSKLGVQLNQIGTEVAMKVKAANEVMEYSKIMADAKMKMGVFYSSRSRDTDNYDTLTDDTDSYFKKMSGEITKGVNDVTQQARVRQGLDQIGSAMHTKATHLHTRALMVQEASFGTDDEMRTVIQNYSAQTRSLAQLGVFEDDDAEKDVLDFYNDAARGKVRRMMNESPQAAVDYLMNQNTLSRLITNTEHRENLLAQAQRLLDAKDRSAEAALKAKEAKEAKAIKDWQSINHINMFDGILDGTSTLENLREKGEHGLLSPSAYTSLHKMLLNRNKEFVGSQSMYQQMREQAWMGELQMAQIMTAVNDEQINYDMAAQLNDDMKKGATIVQTEGYKTHLISLKTMLGWSPMGIQSDKGKILVGKAVVEYRNRLMSGEDILDVYSNILDRYLPVAKRTYIKPQYDSVEEAKKNIPIGPRLDDEIRMIRLMEDRQRSEAMDTIKNKPNAGMVER